MKGSNPPSPYQNGKPKVPNPPPPREARIMGVTFVRCCQRAYKKGYGYDELLAVSIKTNRRLLAHIEAVNGLLKIARCPNKECDNEGTIFNGRDIEPCQWCDERDAALEQP